MCGRFNLTASSQQILDHFQLKRISHYEVSFNIPPGQQILNVVQLDNGSRKGVYLHWGLIPSWSKDSKIAHRLINARAETLKEKPSFRAAYKKRRCLIPATGFFEWQQTENGKQPYHIHHPDNSLFAFAGLWEHWEHEKETIYSCTIITTNANKFMQPIHQRMPVIIAPDDYHAWLVKKTPINTLETILTADAYQQMQLTPISTRVNNPAHNDSDCLLPVDN
jgi:putative SOS response-associated peptidase YedK